MAATPKFKVYDKNRKYQGSLRDIMLAAVVVDVLGDGATIRFGHRHVLWHEGEELQAARESRRSSYGYVINTVVSRLEVEELDQYTGRG